MDCSSLRNTASFWVLEKPEIGTPAERRAWTEMISIPEDKPMGPAPSCSRCGQYVGMLTWLPPYICDLDCWGREYGDFAFGVCGDVLVSERLRALYLDANLVGVSSFDAVVVRRAIRHRRARGAIPKYYKIKIAWTDAVVDRVESGEVWQDLPTCTLCHGNANLLRYERIQFVRGTWTGEDVFALRRCHVPVLVSQRFRDLCVQNDVTNVSFIAADQYWYDRCAYRQPETIAALLAKPAGGHIAERLTRQGHRLRWDRESNIFVFVDSVGYVRGMFEPRDPEEFWRRY